MNCNYEIEFAKLKSDYEKDIVLAFKESDRLYNEIVKELGHKNFLTNSSNNLLTECTRKYQKKFKELQKNNK